MLSEENRNKLVMTGLYKHEPDKKIMRYEDGYAYWCKNWTFKPRYSENTDQYFMVDTYWHEKCVELTDKNFDGFEFLFDMKEVEQHSGNNIYEFPKGERWCVPIDSGGTTIPRFFVKKGSHKVKDKVLDRLQREIGVLEWELQNKKQTYNDVLNDKTDLNYV